MVVVVVVVVDVVVDVVAPGHTSVEQMASPSGLQTQVLQSSWNTDPGVHEVTGGGEAASRGQEEGQKPYSPST